MKSNKNVKPDHQVESFVSTTKAWHQALTFDEPSTVRITIENLGGGPIYGFYVNQEDFTFIEHGPVDDDMMARISSQQLCENEVGRTDTEMVFPAGTVCVCIELDCQSSPSAERAGFRLSLDRRDHFA